MDSTQDASNTFRTPDLWNSVPVPARVAQRASERYEIDENGCWISTYSVGSHGYAQIGWHEAGKTHTVLAHRAAWTYVNGQMPLGMTIDHKCHAKRCVNPAHLRTMTNEQNARRGALDVDDVPTGECLHGHGPEYMSRPERLMKGKRRPVASCSACKAERRVA